jgi:hypothetical protein
MQFIEVYSKRSKSDALTNKRDEQVESFRFLGEGVDFFCDGSEARIGRLVVDARRGEWARD